MHFLGSCKQKFNAAKLFKSFSITIAGPSGNIIEKEPQKPWPTLNIYRKYLFCLQFNASCSFLQICINFVEQRLKFSHSEGSIIP